MSCYLSKVQELAQTTSKVTHWFSKASGCAPCAWEWSAVQAQDGTYTRRGTHQGACRQRKSVVI